MKTVVNWYVVYTMSKCEKKVASNLATLGIECYLPLHYVLRQWSDRKKRVLVPLFPNYVFVRMGHNTRNFAFSVKEIIKFVSVDKKPVVVKETDVETIKAILSKKNINIIEENYFQEGMKIRMEDGPFAGLEGIIVGKSNSARLIVKIEGLIKAYSFNVPVRSANAVFA